MWNQLSSAATTLVPVLQEQKILELELAYKIVYQQQYLPEDHV